MGSPTPLTALCIVYVPAALVSTPGDPSRDTIPGDLLSVYLSLHFYAEYIMRIAGLDEAQAGIKTAGRNTNNLIVAGDTTLNGRK